MVENQPFEQWQSWLTAGAQPFAEMWGNNLVDDWSKALEKIQNFDPSGLVGSAAGKGKTKISFPPEKLLELQNEYVRDATELWNRSLQSSLKLEDRRFSGDAWQRNSMASFSAAVYLLNTRILLKLAEAAEGDAKTRARLIFAVEQWAAASAPTNFLALNPDAMAKAVETKGESLAKGVQNMLYDMRQGRVSMTDESQFQVGHNVATTEGAVVYENELFQLIEYKPLTAKVHEKPLLMVPPCINKYYILDLQPDNSLVRYAISQGMHTFLVSWRNADESIGDKGWDDYLEDGIIKAISVVKEINGADQINALGFCIGGALLTTALAVLAARDEKPVASLTLLTVLLDYVDKGELDIFIDETAVQYREQTIGNGGLLKGQELASTFSFLRPNDLVWNYVVGNYLKGETPPPFDLLYWNSDSTNLPGPFFAWYLRHTYLQNDLVKPGKVTLCGEKIDLNKVDIPVYIYGSQRDHIVPIGGAYASTHVLPGKKRFVMGASGHIAGVINPPAANKRHHWLREDGKFPKGIDDWTQGAEKLPGSWWTDWSGWLAGHSGKQKAAPKRYGKGAKYKELEAAPGRYVKARA